MKEMYLRTRENSRRHKPRFFFHFIIVSIFSILSIPYPGHVIPHSFHLFQLKIPVFSE